MPEIRKILFAFFLFFQIPVTFAQIAPGEWRTHFSYNNASQVAFAGDKAYVVANEKLYSYSEKGILETYSTITGLNGHNVSLISWCEAEKTLIIVYSDGNIDFLTRSGIVNLADFKNKSLTASKTLFGLKVEGEKAYLSTGIGLLVLNVKKKEISETFFLNFSSSYTDVYDAVSSNDTLIIATETGLYTGDTKSNLQDASNWHSMPFFVNLKVKKLVRFANRLFALANNGMLYQNNGSGWVVSLSDPNATNLRVDHGYMFVCAGIKTYMFNSSMELQNVENIQNNDVSMDSDHECLYIASGSNGLCKLSGSNAKYEVSERSIIPNGPASNVAWNSFFKDGAYYSTTGGRWGDRYFYNGDILVFKNENWSNLEKKQEIVNQTGLPLMDFMNLAIDPKDERHFFITSFGEGLYEFRDSVFYKLWNKNNSPLITAISGSDRFVRVDGATFDSKDNLWVLNCFSSDPIKILKKDSTWFIPHYSNMPSAPTWNSILFTKNNQVWINSLRYTYGIFVLDYKEDIENTTDDDTRWLDAFTDQDDNVLSPPTINCITEDHNGSIWIGTAYGPLVVSNPSNVFSSGFRVSRIKIPRNDGTDNADYLLNDIRINCIAVDGANRKWIGTNGNGLYLVSADGLKTVYHFNMENSPLPSDYIWSIAINPETGEVFVGTDTGLVSYRSDATQGASTFNRVYVFPNPVKPEHTGNITVTGLMENTQVKITDLAGNILVSGTSSGGQFTWSGYTRQGKRAASGVYLVFCASEDGIEYQACKFMIVR